MGLKSNAPLNRPQLTNLVEFKATVILKYLKERFEVKYEEHLDLRMSCAVPRGLQLCSHLELWPSTTSTMRVFAASLIAAAATAYAAPQQLPFEFDITGLPQSHPGIDLDLNERRLVQFGDDTEPVWVTELEKV